MNIEQIIMAVVTTIATTVVTFILKDVKFPRKSMLREEYRFIKDFILGLKPDTHPYLVEKGCLAIVGNDKLIASEIRHLLSLKSPTRALKIYATAKSYVEFVETPQEGQKNINFRKKYKTCIRRTIFKAIYFSLYFIFAQIALIPLVFFIRLFSGNLGLGVVITLFDLFSFGIFALIYLSKYKRLRDSEELVNMQ